MIRDRDRGARRVTRALEELDGVGVTVGIHADDGAAAHPSGPPVVDVGGLLEFGTDDAPPLAFVRGTVDNDRRALEAALGRAAEAVARGRGPVARLFGALGEDLAGKMRRRIPSVTGTTAGAVTYRVVDERASE